VISSKTNPAVKQIRSLRQRKEREESGLFFVEGVRIVGEAAETGADIHSCVFAPELLTSRFGHDTVAALRAAAVPCLEVTRGVFDSISLKEGPQGIGAVVRQRWERLPSIVPGDELCWIVLGSVRDPGNLGTILRTADAVGAAGVILLGHSTDPYDPATLRGSMGAIFSQRLVRATLYEISAWKDRHAVCIVGASDGAEADYRSLPYDRPMALFMGSERQGLSTEQQAQCDVMARVPMVGRSDSLNLAVATGVMLYQIFSRHHPLNERHAPEAVASLQTKQRSAGPDIS